MCPKLVVESNGSRITCLVLTGPEHSLNATESLVHRRCQNIKRARAKVSQFQFSEYFSNLEKVLTNPDGSKVPPSNIFNYDETHLSDDPGSKICTSKGGEKYPDRVHHSSKSATSIMFCGSADGTMLPSCVMTGIC